MFSLQYIFNDDLVLVLSKDYGQTWDVIHKGVTAALFKSTSDDVIFALTQVDKSSPLSGTYILIG